MPTRASAPKPLVTPDNPAHQRRPGLAPTVGAGAPKVPRGVHPEPWRLSEALLLAVRRLPYATAEARLLDGVQRFVRLECRAPTDGVSLTPTGPRWAAVLRVVAAVAPLVSEDSRRLLAPWLGAGAGTPGVVGQGAVGVSPHAADAARFLAGLAPKPWRCPVCDDPACAGHNPEGAP